MSDIAESLSPCGLPMSMINLVSAIIDIVIYVLDMRSGIYKKPGEVNFTALSIVVYFIAFIMNCVYLWSDEEYMIYLVLYVIFGIIVIAFNFFDALTCRITYPVASFMFLVCAIVALSILVMTCGFGRHLWKNRSVAGEQLESGQATALTDDNPPMYADLKDDRPPLYPMLIEVAKAETCELPQEIQTS